MTCSRLGVIRPSTVSVVLTKQAIPALLDAFGQIFCDVFFETAQQQWPQLCREPPPRDALADSAFSPCGS
jgi:hypothetical protein